MRRRTFPWAKCVAIPAALCLSAFLCIPIPGCAADKANSPGVSATQQSQTVKGRVLDEFGEPMIGVTVKLKGTSTGAVTDIDGNFSVAAKPGEELEVSCLGYKTLTVRAGAQLMTIKMETDVTGLDDVVVIGYGTMKKRDLTGAISSVTNEDLTLAPVTSPLEALQGKVAGLDITRTSGAAGTEVDIQLRGTRSFTASGDPTVIIDGMPGNLNTLNANDIESIEVLKDAASTAIYGSAGANGVIIVTTKSGKEGKLKVDFNAYVGINGWGKIPEVRQGEEYFNVIKLAQQETGTYIDDASVLSNPYAYEAYLAGEDIDWADEILKTGIIQNYSLSVSGGTEKTKAYMSLNFTDEVGQIRNDDYKVYSTNIRVDHKLNKWLSIGVNMQGSYVYENNAYSLLENAITADPIGSIYDEDGNKNVLTVTNGDQRNLLLNDKSNYRDNSQVTRIYLNPYIRITPLKGLTFESRVNASLTFEKDNHFEGIGSYQYYYTNGSLATGTNSSVYATVEQTNNYNYKWENILSYNFQINEDHDFTVTGVTSYAHYREEYTYSYADSFTTNTYLWHNLGAGSNQQTSSSYTMSKELGFVGRINYSYKGKYLASASIRYDGSSRLADGNRWDTFPAVSVGWRISEEKFMQGTRKWLDNLKLRVGYGVTGTAAIDEYSSVSLLEQSYYSLSREKVLSYNYSQNLANVNLGWEKSKSTDVGIDASFFKGRIDLSLDYYFTKTEDVIWAKSIPITNGGYTSSDYYTMNMNICETENQGIELSLNTRNIIKKDFTWTSALTFAYNHEEITELASSSDYVNNGDEAEGRVLYIGEPVNSWYHYKLNGTWKTSEAEDAAVFLQEPGDLKVDIPGLIHVSSGVYQRWEEVENEDGTITTELVTYDADNPYVISADDYQVLGHESPDWTMGFKNTFTWKNFDLSIYLYWRWGQTINYEVLWDYDPTGVGNFPTYFDYWTSETGDSNHYFPALNSGRSLIDYTGYYGLRYVDGSFFKIKNITLGYTLPKKTCKILGIDNFRIYATITNPLVVAKSDLLEDYDPENAGNYDYPLTKQFVFGVNLTF